MNLTPWSDEPAPAERPPRRRRVVRLVVLAMLINFGLYAGVSWLIGGSAIRGEVDEGRYYVLDTRDRHTRVSEGVYYISKIWGWTVVAGIPVLVLAALDMRRR